MHMSRSFLCSLAFLLFCSCNHYYYAPNSLQFTTIKSQGEVDLSFSSVYQEEFSGTEIQLAASPLKHTLVYGQFFNVQSSSNSDRKGEGQLAELGLGSYFPLGNKGTLTFGGLYGWGSVKNRYDLAPEVHSELFFRKSNLQVGLSLDTKYFVAGIGPRLVWLQYRKGFIDYRAPHDEINAIQHIEQDSPIFFPELGVMAGGGYGPFWVMANFNISYARSKYNFASRANTIGVRIQLEYLWRELKKKNKSHD